MDIITTFRLDESDSEQHHHPCRSRNASEWQDNFPSFATLHFTSLKKSASRISAGGSSSHRLLLHLQSFSGLSCSFPRNCLWYFASSLKFGKFQFYFTCSSDFTSILPIPRLLFVLFLWLREVNTQIKRSNESSQIFPVDWVSSIDSNGLEALRIFSYNFLSSQVKNYRKSVHKRCDNFQFVWQSHVSSTSFNWRIYIVGINCGNTSCSETCCSRSSELSSASR